MHYIEIPSHAVRRRQRAKRLTEMQKNRDKNRAIAEAQKKKNQEKMVVQADGTKRRVGNALSNARVAGLDPVIKEMRRQAIERGEDTAAIDQAIELGYGAVAKNIIYIVVFPELEGTWCPSEGSAVIS